MSDHPLAEIFGFPANNHSINAQRFRRNRLCPYNNKVANCTKDKANDPLGICSIYDQHGGIAITCPIRFRQDWLITEHAAHFFFPAKAAWTSLTEVRLNDKHGKSAGNIDMVLVAYDDRGHILDFGSLEIQAVYISGNIRRPFEHYMQDPIAHQNMDWSKERNYPRPDYLSSSRKRLVPQLLYKGGILKSWGKKQAVALHHNFYDTLPALDEVDPDQADIAWLIYDLVPLEGQNTLQLELTRTVYTMFKSALDKITVSEPGSIDDFMGILQGKLDEKLEDNGHPPDAPTLANLL